MRGPLVSAVGLAALVVGVAAARGDVVVGQGAPFTAAELEDAIAARTGASTGDVAVEPAAGDVVRLVTPDGTWQIGVGDARGAAAARLVALHLVDRAALGTIALPPPRVAVAPSRTPLLEDLTDEPEPATSPVVPAGSSRWLALRTGATRGTSSTDLSGLLATLELGGERASWIAAAELGAQVSGTSSDAGDVRWVMPHVRVSGGRRVGAVELLGGVLLGRAFLANVPDRPAATMVALGGSARTSWPIGRGRWRLVTGLGADAYHHRIVIRRLGVEEASTPRFALTATVGLTVVPGR